MRIIEKSSEACAIALGNFDGLHAAHMKIIRSCIDYSKRRGISSGLVLFDRHTSELFGRSTELLTTMEEKLELLDKTGVDFVKIMHFDKELAETEGEAFIKLILADFRVEAFFTGYDYTFGRGAVCRTEDLRKIGDALGFRAFVTECVKKNGVPVSSTLVREYIAAGDMRGAHELLGRAYSLCGRVVHGKQNGTALLFPTANVEFAKNKLLPPDGVYAARAELFGKKYRCALNIGKNPTFDAKTRTVEGFLLDFEGKLYGEQIRIEFGKRLRADKKFQSVAELKQQIERDIEAVRGTNFEEE